MRDGVIDCVRSLFVFVACCLYDGWWVQCGCAKRMGEVLAGVSDKDFGMRVWGVEMMGGLGMLGRRGEYGVVWLSELVLVLKGKCLVV